MLDKSLLRQAVMANGKQNRQTENNDKSILRRSLEKQAGVAPGSFALTNTVVPTTPQRIYKPGAKAYAPINLRSLAESTIAPASSQEPEAPTYVSPFAKNEDYGELSRYKSTKNSEEIDNRNFLDKAIDWIIGAKDNEESKKYNSVTGYTTKDYDDELYEYINKNPDVVSRVNTNEATSGQYFSGVDQSFLQEMEDAEIADYNYLYATQGKDKANEFLQNLKKDLTKRQMEKYVAENQQYARESPVAASAWSVLAKPLETVGLAGQLMDYKLDRDVDPNAGYNRFAKQNRTIRQTVPENWGKVGQFLYGTGMSIADNVYNMALAGAFGDIGGLGKVAEQVTLGLMSSSAASESVLEALENGYSADRAIIQGALAGGIEYLTEKISWGALMEPNAWKDGTIKYLLKNMRQEGLEEGISTVANWGVDFIGDIITDENRSDIMEAVKDFKSGDSHAGWQKLLDMGIDVALDVAGGALSGGVLAGGGSLVNLAANTVMGRNANADYSRSEIGKYVQGTFNDTVGNEDASDYQQSLAKKAMNQFDQNGKVSNRTLGELMQSNAYMESEQNAYKNLLGEAMEQIDSGKTVNDSTVKEILDNKKAVDYLIKNSGLRLQNGMTRAERFQAVRNSLNQTIQQIDEVQAPARKVISEIRQQNEAYRQKVDMVSQFAKTLGEQGGRTLMRMAANEDLPNITSLAGAYTKVYNEVKANPEVNLNEVSDEIDNRFTPSQLYSVYQAAVADRETDFKENGVPYEGETTNGRSEDNGGNGIRQTDVDSGVGVESISRWTAEAEKGNQTSERARIIAKNRAAVSGQPKVTAQEAGFANGSNREEHRTTQVVPEENWASLDEDTYSFFKELKSQGYNVIGYVGDTFFEDPLSTNDRGEHPVVTMRGFQQGKTIGVRVDAELSARQIVMHELFHSMVASDSALQARMLDKLNDKYKGRMDRVFEDYVRHYEWMLPEDATPEQIKEWENRVYNEILADAYAGIEPLRYTMNYRTASQFTADVREMVTGNGLESDANGTRAGPAFSREELSEIDRKVKNGEGLLPAEEVAYSLDHDEDFIERERNRNQNFVSASVLEQSFKKREQIRNILRSPGIRELLPEDKMGKTSFGNGSYGRSMEHSTICPRTLSMEAILDGLSERFGRPITVDESIKISQLAWAYMDAPECAYCYVAMDRKARREYLLNYLTSRNEVLKNIDSGMSRDDAYNAFLNGRKDTQPMRNRFNTWIRLHESGSDMVEMKDLASDRAIKAAAAKSKSMADQVKDALQYAQSASWAKKYVQYTAYNGEILKWSQNLVNALNRMYGMRMYSFSDFHPAFTLEDMQMITDASLRGLKVLAYTKEIDFARIMEPTGANINISVFAQNTKDVNGDYGMDAMQGADWNEAKALRAESIKNGTGIGITMVCTSDEQIDWALAQDWIDVVIPFHMVKTGAEVAKAFGWNNYTDMQGDRKLKDLWDGKADEKMIEPPEHQNNKQRYLDALEENHLTPRFEKWVDDPNYMKLVNETRRAEGETPTVQPVFNLDAADEMFDRMKKQGGYYQHLGLDTDVFEDLQDTIYDDYVEKYGEPMHYSRDTDYMEAVNSGDMDTAQRMVDEAAKDAGYSVKSYHGTLSGGFTVFDRSYAHVGGNSGAGFYTSTTRADAEGNYSDVEGADNYFKARDLADKIEEAIADGFWEGPELSGEDEILEYAKQQITKKPQTYTLYGNPGKTYVRDYRNSTNIYDDIMEDFNESLVDREDYDSDEDYEDDLFNYQSEHLYESIENAVYEAMDSMEDQYEYVDFTFTVADLTQKIAGEAVDYQSLTWEDISGAIMDIGEVSVAFGDENEPALGEPELTRAIIEALGYDSITDREVSKKFNQIQRMGAVGADTEHVIYFRPEQMKLADTVTRDDQGNVIPLSQRFNKQNDDIRYSRDSDQDNRVKANFGTMFSGTGTVDFALRNVINHSFAVEYDNNISAVYRMNNGDEIYEGDVRDAVKQGYIDDKEVDFLHASPVCKDYSAQKQDATETPLDISTAKAVADVIDSKKPRLVTIENVRGYKNSQAVKLIQDALDRNGYVWDEGTYKASDFGGATIRERYFIRAARDVDELPAIPEKKQAKSWYDATKDLIPDLKEMPLKEDGYMASRWNEIKDSIDTSHPVLLLRGTKGGKLVYAEYDKPSPTIIASETEARIVMPDGRFLEASPRVLARIQGLPDEFQLPKQKTLANKVVGNGVPVELTQAVLGSLLPVISGEEYSDIRFSRDTSGGAFNELYTTLEDGRIKPNNVEDLSTEDWKLIYKAVNKLGYGMESVKQTKEIYSRYVGENGFNKEQSEAIKKAYGVTETSGVAANPKREALARKTFGTTGDFREAGYLMRNGSMLDFSGKKDGGPAHVRYMDHREIGSVFSDGELSEDKTRYGDNTAYMNAFISEGNIRLMEGQGVTIGEMEPTSQQYTVLKQFIDHVLKNEDYFYLDLSNNDGYTVASRDYSSSDGAQKIIRDIKEYFKNGELPYRSDLAQFRYSRDTTGMESELQKQNRELNRELKEVTERYHYFKDQLVLTKVRQATEQSANRVAKQLVKDYSSNVSADEIAKALREASKLVLNVKDDTDIDELQTQLKDALRPYAMQMVTNASELMNAEDVETQKSIRNDLRNGAGIIVTEQMKKDVPDWASFRKAQFGNMKLVSGPKTNIHDVYLELSQKYGEGYFPQDVANESDMLQVIADVMADLSAIYDNPYTYGGANIAEAIESCTNDMMMSVVGSLEAESPTFADKEKAKRDALRKQAIEAKNAALQRVREQRDDALAKQSARYKDRIDSIYRKRKQYEYRGKIRKKSKDLSTLLLRPTDKKHIPYSLQGVVLDVLNSINTGSKFDLDVDGNRVPLGQGIQTKKTSAYLRLKEQLTQLKNQLVVDPDLFDTEDTTGMLSILTGLEDTSIDAMNTEQLEAVYTVLRNVENIVRTYNKAFNQARFDTISEAAVALHDENANKTGRPEYTDAVEKTLNLLTVDMLTPEAYFRRMGKSGSSLFKMLRNAQDKNIQILKEAQEFTEANGLYKLKLKKYENDLLTVKFGNRDVKLSKAQLMELYVLNKREASRQHIQVGGIIPEPVQNQKSLKKNTYIEPVRNITQEDLAKAFSQLTAEDIQIAEKLQEFVSTVMTDHGNEASMKVYGYKKFGDENYWPIRVNEKDLRSELGAVRTRSRTVSNKGFTNALKPNANQSVSIGSIFDTFTEHVAEMANYSAFLDTMEDLKRIYNYTERGEGGAIDLSIKYDINNVFGNKGTKYFEKLMEDVSNGMISEQSYFGGLIGRFKAAAVGSNLRVIIQQPTAIFRAMDMISPKYMAIGIAKFNQGAKKAAKNSPIAQWKDWGYFDINTGRSTKNILFENSNTLDRVQSVLMSGAGKADSVAWGALYSAVEAEIKDTRKDLDPRSKEFDKVVADRFADIIDHSQVVDGVLQRSGIMRSTNAIDKMATSFMGEPIKQFNMLATAIYDMRNASPENKAQASRTLGRTVAAMAVAGVLNAAVQSIIDAMRNDDPEKDYWEKFLEKFTGDEATFAGFMSSNMGDLVNPLQYVPYAKDIVSIMQGYDVERMDVSLVNDLYTDAKYMVNAFQGKGKYSMTNTIMNFLNTASKFFGLSIGNVKRDVAGIANTIAQETGSYVFEYRMSKFTYNLNQATNKGRFVEVLAKAYEAGDTEAFNIIMNDLIKEDKFATTTMTTEEWIKKRLKDKHQIILK